jgi:DNA-binding response OmpR family regulator
MEHAAELLAGGSCRALVVSDEMHGPDAVRRLSVNGLLLRVAVFGVAGSGSGVIDFLKAGADDCFFKGQNLAEITERFRAVMRRMFFPASDELLNVDGLEINLTRRRAVYGGTELELTVKEFDLLFALLSNPGRVLDRIHLLRQVWGPGYFGSPRTVDVHMSRLRGKLDGLKEQFVTIPCVGYKFERRMDSGG